MGLITYNVRKMRVVKVTGKLAAKYPERAFTVHGEFHGVDAKGKVIDQPLTITSKVIEIEDVNDPGFRIDLASGTLTVPAGERGRKQAAGLDVDGLAEMLATLRGGTAEADQEQAPQSAE